ncbi:retron St85 family RNA-directed DNA polymerase [Raoultella planticola]|uniref:retron St85 family RNA-directed DNA polymerase n=1 Tax=Raoultella planticola TaxID=575 RepID=UPI001034927F|nr:retron St85 family RNA-directed DNA polymerase [Raoultella planticola]
MTLSIRRDILSWAIAVIQPATISDIYNFLTSVLKDKDAMPSRDAIVIEVLALIELNDIARVSQKPTRYSITAKGNNRLNKRLRHLRDRMRLFLLKNAYRGSLKQPSAIFDEETNDVSSFIRKAVEIKDAQRPNSSLVADQTAVWSLVSEQFSIGPNEVADGVPLIPTFYSFDANYFDGELRSIVDLSEAIGISIRLITSIVKNKQKHYRTFPVIKKSGGERVIDAPRTFLKVIQRWLSDFLLNKLPVHDFCFSYKKGQSIRHNAQIHVGKKFVLNIDVKDFFGSITKKMIFTALIENGFENKLAKIVSELCTYNDRLPQGAPSSPILSNSILYKMDCFLTEQGVLFDYNYSRYADDITISSNDRLTMELGRETIFRCLNECGFDINDGKTRVAATNSRQIVTGLVVNKKVQPTRAYRRKVRAMFDHAKKNPDSFTDRYNVLTGCFYYLTSFGCISHSKINEYENTLSLLKELAKR